MGSGVDPEPPFPCPPQKSTLIKLASIRAAEKVEEKSFSSSHVMQVIYTDDTGQLQTAYLQCKVRLWRGRSGRDAVGAPVWAGMRSTCLPPPWPPHQAQQGVWDRSVRSLSERGGRERRRLRGEGALIGWELGVRETSQGRWLG